ncbi:MAG: amino acid ABC transporter permease, partial [Duodenibacillus sp.]|nr:amino acid ABC transporter permease [Duodenibacillus sp.]
MNAIRLDVLAEYWPLFIDGAVKTLELTVGCVCCGVVLGMLLGMA